MHMMPPPSKARRLPGHLDCTAEMFHGSGRKAAREGEADPDWRSSCQTGEEKASKDVGIRSFSAFV